MTRAGANKGHEVDLADLIRQQIRTRVNRRHLSRIPPFAIEREMPETLERLMGELDAAERTAGVVPGES